MTRPTTVKTQARHATADAEEHNHAGKGSAWTTDPSPSRQLIVPLHESGATVADTILGWWRSQKTVNTDQNITFGNRTDDKRRTPLTTLTYYVNYYVLRKGSIERGVWKGGMWG